MIIKQEFIDFFRKEIEKQEISLSKKETLNVVLADLIKEAHSIAKEKGWYDTERPIPECLALIHSEVSEALECYRTEQMETTFEENGKPIGFKSEIADIFIRLFDLCGYLNIDIEEEILKKMEYNKTRSYRHGGKKA